jgi:8-oxo-dGTP pyrophosphatase MutT (NUDIX family)
MSASSARARRGDPAARRESAVLVPVYRDETGALRVVLVRRALGGIHGGQLAFPGGMREPTDASARDTAVREAHEEIGLEPGRVAVIAELAVVETRTSNFHIAPFLARIERPAYWRPAFREVAEVLEPSLAELADPSARGEAVETFATWQVPMLVPFIRIGEHRLWGATYRIINPLLPRLLAGEWSL